MADWANTSDIKVVYDGYDISKLIIGVSWSGDTERASRSVTVNMVNTLNGIDQRIQIEEGKSLVFSNNEEELFRGVVFFSEIDTKGNQAITAYDENIYLQKNSDTRKFKEIKASDIIKKLCNDYGISTGTIADTGFVIPKLIARNQTLYEIIREALDITYKQNGRKFYLTSEKGRVTLVERSNRTVDFSVENGKNILEASYSKSIEDTKTRVKVIAGDVEEGKLSVEIAQDGSLESRFGVMQHVEEVSTDTTVSERKQRAQELLKQLSTIKDEAKIDALGDNRIKSGMQINVKESMTGLIGTYYVVSDSHTFENGAHIMSLIISANDA